MIDHFRNWFDKFKAKNQVVFGVASEFKECWEDASTHYQDTINTLQETAIRQGNLLLMMGAERGKVELANKNLKEAVDHLKPIIEHLMCGEDHKRQWAIATNKLGEDVYIDAAILYIERALSHPHTVDLHVYHNTIVRQCAEVAKNNTLSWADDVWNNSSAESSKLILKLLKE